MKLEKRRFDDVLILRFVGEFDSFNLPGFSERIDHLIDGGDRKLIVDAHLLKFINSAALGYLIKTRRRLAAMDGELVLARPSKFVRRTLTTLGLDSVFGIYDSVESALLHFKKGIDIGELDLEGGDEDETLMGRTPLLFRSADSEGGQDEPNQVGRIVRLYPDGLAFRYEPSGAVDKDPVASILAPGRALKLKFRQPFALKDHYFEMTARLSDVARRYDEEEDPVLEARVVYDAIGETDREHLDQFVRDQELWRGELGPSSRA